MDENLRMPDRHASTIGILLCAGRNDNVVRYSLAGTTAPLAVANYTYETLPDPIRALVPTDNELASAVDATLHELTAHSAEDGTADDAHERSGTGADAPPASPE